MSVHSPGVVEEIEAAAGEDLVEFGAAVVARIRAVLVAEGHCKPGSPLLDEAFAEPSADGAGIAVGLGSDVAAYLEYGTAPHFIPNGLGIQPGVDHPGTDPYYTVRRAVLAEADARDLS